jgi:HD-GYP domain-containing protein (c-di-GMP phosphodiesterase class II)
MGAAVYDYRPLITNSGLDHSISSIALAVRTNDQTIVFGNAGVFKLNPVIKRIQVGQEYWEIAAVPVNGWNAYRNMRILPMILAGLVIVFMLAGILTFVATRQDYLTRLIAAGTKDIAAANEALSENIAKEKAAVRDLAGLNRLYSLLSRVNETIVRAPKKAELLEKVCRTIVDAGGYRMCWIGLIDKETNRVVPIGAHGVVEGYFDNMNIVAPKSAKGHGPKARALMAKKAFISNDVEHDPEMAPWLELSMQHGYRSEASFPLVISGVLIGSLNLYSAKAGEFTDEDIRLLGEVANDIAFALESFEKEAVIEHLASFPRLNPNPVIEFDISGKIKFANDAANSALTAIGGSPDLNQFAPKDFAAIAAMMDMENPPETLSREVSIQNRMFSEIVHLLTDLKTIRLYATDITERYQTEKLEKQRKAEVERNYEVMRRSLDGTVKAIAAVAEHKDPYTTGHEKRVVEMAMAIGRELDQDETFLEGLRIAATLHDIGKIYIPAEILSKPGTLNDLEFSMIKQHPRYSFDILSKIDFPWPVAETALQHHERMDGSGYPQGLKGEDIKLEARILAVADVIEAMGSHRPYRPALTIEEALDEIRKGKGGLYDERVASAALLLFKTGFEI